MYVEDCKPKVQAILFVGILLGFIPTTLVFILTTIFLRVDGFDRAQCEQQCREEKKVISTEVNKECDEIVHLSYTDYQECRESLYDCDDKLTTYRDLLQQAFRLSGK